MERTGTVKYTVDFYSWIAGHGLGMKFETVGRLGDAVGTEG
jgi:hypothetical protein